MKIFYNSKLAKVLLFNGYSTIMLFGSIFTKYNKEQIERTNTINHESIHVEQYKTITLLSLIFSLFIGCFINDWEVFIINSLISLFIYYIWYCLEFLIKLICIGNWKKAYKNISFEVEAYKNEKNNSYLDYIKVNGIEWYKYIFYLNNY